MTAQVLLRVDDCGWVPPDKTDDRDLAYFLRWRDSVGVAGAPAFYGFIPTTVGDAEVAKLRAVLAGREEVAVHGWDHARGAGVGPDLMREAVRKFDGLACRSYIPPFNEYTDTTIRDWAEVCPGGLFFGGFPAENHIYPDWPVDVPAVHLSALRPLYGRVGEVLSTIDSYLDLDCPLVVTLHVTWDVHAGQRLQEFGEKLRPLLVGREEVGRWLDRSRLDRTALTAPHYLAYSWVLSRVRVGETVMDFGSRYSVLPAHLALRGCRVTPVDRDPAVREHQDRLGRQFGVRLGEP
ncbi:MAG TPA: hypothetical protein VKE74_07665, partial [Gemmataceae bacterium]|nr:hypothetical protein [Gemmataceae bacterium]